ncbi:hypothetical protein DICPUDRAFT_148176 [Dictyostelium purpureum]|uniref:Pesticidal crystal protein N-terminal domain-containing protein n=1 Tax=Dictyostelium purpureum TaxID=5786 RepID=F0ZAG2_DICPU|nr:uncharacterized protein DICPUDRAFT_148176 [Dictyostelium purpureum]EGC39063.1 hypothetical protein DICPUDRAFT_148176 [Dictyostelium purpureum]|eukprot:XP_003284413.1 hypothetical protein DICPUDRAFT_148176 [Dictyostelium purpureum]
MEVKSKGIKSSEDSFMDATGSVLSGAIGSIPVVGSFLSGIFGAFWPGPKYLTVEDFQREIKKLKEEMIALMDQKIDAALDKVFNAIIDTEVLSLINSGNNFSDAVNLWAERNGQKVSNVPKKKSKFAMEIQELGDEAIKELCRTQYQIFTGDAERCIILLSDDRFNEYSLNSLVFAMAHYASAQLECIANGVTWGFPEGFIEGNGGSVVGVRTKLHERINKFHMDFGKGYYKALKKGAHPSDGSMWRIVAAAGLVHYSDKRLFKYPVIKSETSEIVMKEFQRTYVPWVHIYRNQATTKDDNILDHVSSQYQITPLPNQTNNEILLFTFKCTTPPCRKLMLTLHLAAFNSNQYTIISRLTGGATSQVMTNSLTMDCPTMEVIRESIVHGGQTPSGIKYGIHSHTYEVDSPRTSFEFKISRIQTSGSQSDYLHIEDINFTALE